jgi:hypothetical protein
MVERLGDVLYRAACIAAVLWAIFILVVAPALAQPDWTIWTPIAAAGAVAIWGVVVRFAICYLVTDFFRGAAAKHPSLAAEANLPSSDTNRPLLSGDAVAS